MMDELDNILSNIDLEEEKNEIKEDYADEWWCMDCEHGPMDEKDDKCVLDVVLRTASITGNRRPQAGKTKT